MGKNKINALNLIKISLRLLLLLGLLTFSVLFVIFLSGYLAATKPKSYLPDFDVRLSDIQTDGINTIGLSNSSFNLSVNEQGVVNIKTSAGEDILTSLIYYASYDGSKESWGLDDISSGVTSDSTVSISGKGPTGNIVSILLTVPKSSARIDVDINTKYVSPSLVKRESLAAFFGVPVSEVYCRHGQIAVDSLDPEYWLQRQGVKFGTGNKSALVYHTQGVSSLQLDVKRDLLFFNLEYSLDHPHINIPYQEDRGTRGRWEDQSMAVYKPGQARFNSFSIYLNNVPEAVPRFMLVPDGFLAGYVFTEHADLGKIESHRAVYFGSDTVTKIENAVGGFAGNRIPVTKSVFYADPDRSNHPSIKDDPSYPQYLDLLDQLHRTGMYEICLHTPENSAISANRELLEESIKFMKERFDAVTWIDHGMYGGKLNREAFVADGLNPESENYAADIWEKYDTRYFWNTAVEMQMASITERLKNYKLYDASYSLWSKYFSAKDLKELSFFSAFIDLIKRYTYNGESNSLLPVKGNAHPGPVYYQHITRTRQFYSWATNRSTNYTNLWTDKAEKQHEWDLKQVQRLLDERGIYLNHGYFITNRPGYDTTEDLNGKVTLNPYFEKMLENLAGLRDSGDLYITTIRDLLDYWIMTEKISFRYLPDGVIHVYNNNDKPVKGLSLIVRSENVLVNGVVPRSRKVGDETIFWFDINPGDHAVLKVI